MALDYTCLTNHRRDRSLLYVGVANGELHGHYEPVGMLMNRRIYEGECNSL